MPPPLLIQPSSTPFLDEDDSFFELEIASLHHNMLSSPSLVQRKNPTEGVDRELAISHQHVDHGEKNFSKRKILPIEGLYRPQSPISLLKSAPKFRVFRFSQSKPTTSAPKEIQPFFTRSSSLRKGEKESGDKGDSGRFSMDVIHKYLRLVKPLYAKALKKQGKDEEECHAAATSASPPLMGSRSKQFGKSRSASAAATRVVLSPGRIDDSLLQQHDGIQSAILHCKRSFSTCKDFSPG